MVTVYSVASIKGGVGKTTVAENLGVLLARAGRKVLLVDADLAMGGLTTVLGVGERPVTLHDLLAGRGEPEKAVYEIHGVHLLPSGPTISGFLRADPTKLKEVLDELGKDYDFVLIDTPPGISKYSLMPLKLCDEVLVVVTPDLAATDAAARLEAITELVGAKVRGVIVNRVKEQSFLDKLLKRKSRAREIIQQRLKAQVLGAVPEDPAVVESANLRRPVVLLKPKSAASRGFRALAAALA